MGVDTGPRGEGEGRGRLLGAAEETRGLAATRGGVLDHARPRPVFSAHRSDLDRRGCLEAPA